MNKVFEIEVLMNAVDSSNVEKIGYNEAQMLLEVQYKGGARYRYTGVPKEFYKALEVAPSKGAFIAKHIKPAFAAHKFEVEKDKISKKTACE